MGNVVDKCCGRQRNERKINLLLIGLDNAGKTKTANNLTGHSDREVCPTVGFKAYNLVHRRYPVVIYDLGGGSGFRGIWDQYYSDVHGVIFVVDSTDLGRLEECREVLKAVLSHEKISGKPLLILANKQDVQGALDDVDLVERLDIEAVVNRYRCPTRVEAYTNSVDLTGKRRSKDKMDPGLYKGYSWLLNYIIHRYGDLNLRVQTDINTERTRRMLRAKQKEIGTSTSETQSGFENPNYKPVEVGTSDGIIVVREASVGKSIDYDAIEVADITDDREERIDSVFGDKLENGAVEAPIELEVRTNVRKLSPIVRGRFTVTARNEGDGARPQTSPMILDNSLTSGDFIKVNHSASMEKVSRGMRDVSSTGTTGRTMEVGILPDVPTGGPLSGKRQVLPPIVNTNHNSNGHTGSPNSQNHSVEDKQQPSPIQMVSERSHKTSPTTNHSDSEMRQNTTLNNSDGEIRENTTVNHSDGEMGQISTPNHNDSEMRQIRTLNHIDSEMRQISTLNHNDSEDGGLSSGDGRPQSATQAVRQQLEKTRDNVTKTLSIKNLKRNRTSPEIKSSIFAYDPSSVVKPYAGDSHQQGEGGEFSSKTKNYGRVGLRSDTVM